MEGVCEKLAFFRPISRFLERYKIWP